MAVRRQCREVGVLVQPFAVITDRDLQRARRGVFEADGGFGGLGMLLDIV